MKLVFNSKDAGMTLAYVECVSTEEADNFLNWFASKMNQPVTVAPTQVVDAEVVENAPAEPVQTKPKASRADVSQAAIALVQSKGRDALTPILAKYNAKRIAEIGEDNLFDALADIQSAQGAA